MESQRQVPGPRPGLSASSFSGGAVLEALADLKAEAVRQRETFRNEPTASAIEFAVQQIESALRSEAGEILTLAEAATRSGYSEEHLARLVRQKQIPDIRPSGYLGRIRIRVADLPLKPARQHIPGADDTHSPAASVEARRA